MDHKARLILLPALPSHLLTSYTWELCLVLSQRGREASKKNMAEIARKPGQTRYKADLRMEMKIVIN